MPQKIFKSLIKKVKLKMNSSLPMLKVGETAPDFSVKNHLGENVSLKDYLGQNVVLWFYPKADTPGCTIEGKTFRDRKPSFDDKNVVVFGVSFDSVEENANFCNKFNFNFQLLCDTEREIGLAYGACKTKTAGYAARISYLIDTEGKIKAVFPAVSPSENADEILALL